MWADVAMDFIKGFSHINGKLVILTVVDRLSKYEHLIHLGPSIYGDVGGKGLLQQQHALARHSELNHE
jgi:hypothetical protein